MSKEMNNNKFKITKYNMICGLFMSLIIGIFISHYAALTFFLGVSIGTINYILSSRSILKYLGKDSMQIVIMMILRAVIIALCIIPFVHNIELVVSYITGFSMHLIILGYCTISRKGSA